MGDGFLVCWDGDRGIPGGRMRLLWRWQRQAKDDCRESGELDGMRIGRGRFNK